MVSSTLYTEGSGVLGDRENRIAAHLTAFRDNFHTLHQATSRSMSDCRRGSEVLARFASMDLMNLVSSANR